MEASRILNLYQFTQLYKDITSQAAGVLAQSDTSEEAAESWTSLSSCQASLWMGRYFDTLWFLTPSYSISFLGVVPQT